MSLLFVSLAPNYPPTPSFFAGSGDQLKFLKKMRRGSHALKGFAQECTSYAKILNVFFSRFHCADFEEFESFAYSVRSHSNPKWGRR
ncbi:hypothetical protein [Pandoravirus japonicus]|uniref:Uncharacterized protein n=1 Tax=Pandoravirus japonicus TaxID=2823154 RepID=A0A811BRI5_9VIRU|nr:hypothetical protein [Pandoravirus japonicus]